MSSLKTGLKRLAFRWRGYRLEHLRNRCRILAYHMITPSLNGFYPQTQTDVFRREMEHLAANYRVLPLEELGRRLREGRSVRGCIAITFDDGFRDNYTNAYPVLKALGLPATIFLITECVDTGRLPWFIGLRRLFMETTHESLDLEMEGGRVSLNLKDSFHRKQASDRVMAWVQQMPDEKRKNILEELHERLGGALMDPLENIMLTWDQVREMSNNGIRFGAHTVSHPVLRATGAAKLLEEISRSRDRIWQETGLPVSTFAYPFGRRSHYPRETPALLEKLGFVCAVTTEPGTNDFHTPIYELKRSPPWEFSLLSDGT
ncbi:MAG: polysaccharide deacetylase family protein [Desulfosoma sp.]